MINQEKTGRFIADLRKEKNLTQKQLADMLNVSDKAVSRWETCKSMQRKCTPGCIIRVCYAPRDGALCTP